MCSAALGAAFALTAMTSDAVGDGAWVNVESDSRGQIVAVVPRQHMSIPMRNETVDLVPFFDPAVSSEHPLVYVNVHYVFTNPRDATTLHVGFPELRGRVTKQSYGYEGPAQEAACGDHAGTLDVTCPSSIDNHRGRWGWFPPRGHCRARHRRLRALVRVRRSFRGASRDTSLRKQYIARLGHERTSSNVASSFTYELEYVSLNQDTGQHGQSVEAQARPTTSSA